MNGSFDLGVESRSFSFGLMWELTSAEAFVVQLTSAHSSRAGFLLHRRGVCLSRMNVCLLRTPSWFRRCTLLKLPVRNPKEFLAVSSH